MLKLTDNKLSPISHWGIPLQRLEVPSAKELDLFDTNGYDLTLLEQS